MKKIAILFVFAVFAASMPKILPEKVFAQQNLYAKVTESGTYLCSSPSQNAALFEIPTSYFVWVENSVSDFFKVSYNGIAGYVEKSKVSLMNGTPTTPYASATFSVFVSYSMRKSASSASEVVTQIDEGETLNFFGKKSGQKLTSGSDVWYYASITQNSQTFFGYVFSGVTDLLTNIQTNTETFEIVSEDSLFEEIPSELSTLSTGTKVMLIVSISLPSVLILYFLIKPSKIMQHTNARKKLKKENKKIHHGDYFEFEEEQL